MNWASAADFFAMGGYAFYVWGSFGMCLFALAAETILLARRRRSFLARLRSESSPNP